MTTEITTKKDPALLAVEIRSLHSQAQKMALSYAVEIGRRLVEAKAAVPHGEWGEWLQREVDYSQSTAQNFMRIFERYGQEQISLYGEVKPQVIETLTYTKALRLLAVPEDEVEEFMEAHDVKHMSTRELEQAIQERDAARREAAAAQETAAQQIAALEAQAQEARAAADQLRGQLEELQHRPVEVAVEAPSEEMLEQIRAQMVHEYVEERDKLQKAADKAQKKAEKLEKQVKDLEAGAQWVKEEAKAEMQRDLDAATAARSHAEAETRAAQARAEDLENRLKTADGDAAAFKIYFSSVQEDCNRMLGLIQKAAPEAAEKYRKALRSLLDTMTKAVG